MTTVPTSAPHRRPPRTLGDAGVLLLVVAAGVVALLLANEWGTRWSPEHVVQGSGIAAVQSRAVAEFTAVEAAGASDVTVRGGDEQAVVVTADANLIDRVTTEVEGRILVVGMRGSFTTQVPVTVDVTVPELDTILLTGSGVVIVDDVEAAELTVRMPGTGVLVVRGSAERLDVDLSGSGNVRLEELVAEDVVATLSGFGRLEVHATRSLDATISGTGTIVYDGGPTRVTQQVTGVGAVERAKP